MYRTNIMRDEDYKKIEELDKKLKNDPNNIDLLMQRAFVFFDRYDDKNAIESYEEIIKKFPQYITAYILLSYYLYQIACNIPEAIKTENQA
jgi:Tfp pilus assembly protein PilF